MSRKLSPKYTILWSAWLVSLIVIETVALATADPGDTLSEHVWAFRRWAGSAGTAAILALLAWMGYHFTFEGSRQPTSRPSSEDQRDSSD